jgi:hypothetical protein
MSMFENPNFVRDVFWTVTLNRMFEATEGLDEVDRIEFVDMNYMIIRIMPDVAVIVKLPENAENYSEEQIAQFMSDMKVNLDLMAKELQDKG